MQATSNVLPAGRKQQGVRGGRKELLLQTVHASPAWQAEKPDGLASEVHLSLSAAISTQGVARAASPPSFW